MTEDVEIFNLKKDIKTLIKKAKKLEGAEGIVSELEAHLSRLQYLESLPV